MKERLSDQKKNTPAEVAVVNSSLNRSELDRTYRRMKNEGKCCEGGSEGWSG